MPPPSEPIALVEQLADRIVAALREAASPVPMLLDAEQAAAYAGVSRSGWYRLVAAGVIPQAIRIEGVGPRWRRSDIDRWVERLRPSRKLV